MTAIIGSCPMIACLGGRMRTARSCAANTPMTWPATIAVVQVVAIVVAETRS
jgi:hypothetical protein